MTPTQVVQKMNGAYLSQRRHNLDLHAQMLQGQKPDFSRISLTKILSPVF